MHFHMIVQRVILVMYIGKFFKCFISDSHVISPWVTATVIHKNHHETSIQSSEVQQNRNIGFKIQSSKHKIIKQTQHASNIEKPHNLTHSPVFVYQHLKVETTTYSFITLEQFVIPGKWQSTLLKNIISMSDLDDSILCSSCISGCMHLS